MKFWFFLGSDFKDKNVTKCFLLSKLVDQQKKHLFVTKNGCVIISYLSIFCLIIEASYVKWSFNSFFCFSKRVCLRCSSCNSAHAQTVNVFYANEVSTYEYEILMIFFSHTKFQFENGNIFITKNIGKWREKFKSYNELIGTVQYTFITLVQF